MTPRYLDVLIWQLLHLDTRVGGGGCCCYREDTDLKHKKYPLFFMGWGSTSAPTMSITTFTKPYTASSEAEYDATTLCKHL